MSARRVDDDATFLRQAVELEGSEEHVKQAGVVAVLDVLEVQLPVVRQCLRKAADHLDGLVQHTFDARADLGTQVILDGLDVVAEAAKHQATEVGHAQLARRVVLFAKRLGHTAFAMEALLEGHALERALQVIGPGVVDAGEALGRFTLVIKADQGAAMGAAVLEGVDLARPIAGDHHRRVAHKGGAPVAGVRHIGLKAQEAPGRSLKNPLLLLRIDIFRLRLEMPLWL